LLLEVTDGRCGAPDALGRTRVSRSKCSDCVPNRRSRNVRGYLRFYLRNVVRRGETTTLLSFAKALVMEFA